MLAAADAAAVVGGDARTTGAGAGSGAAAGLVFDDAADAAILPNLRSALRRGRVPVVRFDCVVLPSALPAHSPHIAHL